DRHPILSQFRVCLYDSNEFRNAALSSCFNHLGLKVSHFLNLGEFLDEINNYSNYDICVLSLNNQEPESDEIRNAFKYLNENSGAKIMAFIYNKEITTKSHILNLGADACLSRPCLQSNLLTTVSRLLNLDKGKSLETSNKIDTDSIANIADTSESVTLHGLKILVAEDNPINTKLLLTVLKGSGAECLHANNGEEAINIYKENKINLVLMDKQMPVVSGFDAAKRIRELENHKSSVPIIGLTAATTVEELNEFMASGIDDILTKPISTEDLIHEILYWINHYNKLRNEQSEKNSDAIKDAHNKQKYKNNFNSINMNSDLASSLRKMLVDELPNTLAQLQETYSRNDWSALREQLHKLLGGLSYCALPELLRVTKLAKSSVEQQSDSLDKDFKALLREIDNTLETYMNPGN
ncbi:MAG: response regulator, partial [Gammaproteobacteria bacterium]|nr:response regulator [Gammaproteobacteria bacterium]